jgi:dTMP kinase
VIRFITFEGGDGSGKTTQLNLLAKYLSRRGRGYLCTREPGATKLGKMIRRVLLEAGDEKIASETELFLYLADRAQHVCEIIRPALAAGQIVLCDRFTDSTVAYQGYGRGVDLRVLGDLNRIASGGLTPDLTFFLDCAPELGLARTAERMAAQRPGERREDRFEREAAEFHARVRKGFQELARSDGARIRLLDASRSAEDLHEEIRSIVEAGLDR